MSETRQLVIFSLAREEYALPITPVQEIIRYTEPRSVASRMPILLNPDGLLAGITSPSEYAGSDPLYSRGVRRGR